MCVDISIPKRRTPALVSHTSMLTPPLEAILVMDFDRHNVCLPQGFQPFKQHTVSNQTVAAFDNDCTFLPARIDVKMERAYATVDLLFRDVRLDFGHYGTDSASSDDGFFHGYQDAGLKPHDESDYVDCDGLTVLFALIVFEVRRDWICAKQTLQL
jgi:hypothetical protein